AEFDKAFGLPDPPSFIKESDTGSTTTLPAPDPSGSWEVEESLDVEWAHAIAPAANIVLIECADSLYNGVAFAKTIPGVSVESNSWGGAEFKQEEQLESLFTTPAGHQGITYL